MPESFDIYPFLAGNRAEVKNLFLTKYNEEKILEQERAEGREEGFSELNDLYSYLYNQGRFDDLKKAFMDAEYRNELLEMYKNKKPVLA